jgi:hypothetical protein
VPPLPSESTPNQRHFFSLAALHARSANLHQLIDATFYLFGFIFFLTSPFVFLPLASSSTPGWTFIANLSFYFAFAANVFFVLHSVRWFACALRATLEHLKHCITSKSTTRILVP